MKTRISNDTDREQIIKKEDIKPGLVFYSNNHSCVDSFGFRTIFNSHVVTHVKHDKEGVCEFTSVCTEEDSRPETFDSIREFFKTPKGLYNHLIAKHAALHNEFMEGLKRTYEKYELEFSKK